MKKTTLLLALTTLFTGCTTINQKMEDIGRTGIPFNPMAYIDSSTAASANINQPCTDVMNYSTRMVNTVWPRQGFAVYRPLDGFLQTNKLTVSTDDLRAFGKLDKGYLSARMVLVIGCKGDMVYAIANYFGSNNNITWSKVPSNGKFEVKIIDGITKHFSMR